MAHPNAHHIHTLKRALLARRAALLRSAHDELAYWSEHPMVETAGEAPDSGDDAVASLTADIDHTMLQRHVEAIRDIDAAIARMETRKYASCIDCGDDIGFDRLAAFPTAKRCIACQRRHEATFAESAGITL